MISIVRKIKTIAFLGKQFFAAVHDMQRRNRVAAIWFSIVIDTSGARHCSSPLALEGRRGLSSI
jgi:hypothetical protein